MLNHVFHMPPMTNDITINGDSLILMRVSSWIRKESLFLVWAGMIWPEVANHKKYEVRNVW